MGIKYKVNANFFEKWTPEMAYLLGYLYADGSLEDASYLRGKYLRLTSTDFELVDFTKKVLGSEHTIVTIPPKSKLEKTRYFLRIGNHKIFDDLIGLGLHPKKSLTMKFPQVPQRFLSHFVRGYFDGDGHVGIVKSGNSFRRVTIVFVSGSLDFLIGVANCLEQNLGLRINKVYKRPGVYRLAYSTHDSIKVFKYMYADANGVFLRRKFGVFKKFFNDYNKWVDSEIQGILSVNGRVVK